MTVILIYFISFVSLFYLDYITIRSQCKDYNVKFSSQQGNLQQCLGYFVHVSGVSKLQTYLPS
uniref:Uncharacterized protein n=1 Tax=Anguilla anguilla TaxID=7936 RepID=A0A0E9VUK7_ANGAN